METTAGARIVRPPTVTPSTRRPATWMASTRHCVRTSTPLRRSSRAHQAQQPLRAALERIHPLAHEIGEDDAVADGRVFQRRAVGVGDGFHEQPDDVFPAGEESLEELAGGRRLIVVEVHAPRGVEEPFDGLRRHAEALDQKAGEIRPVEGGPQREARVVEANVLQLHDGVGDLGRPIAAAALDHAHRKAVQGHVEQAAAAAAEPGRQAAQLRLLLQEQDRPAGAGQHVGRGQAGQSAADHDHVVAITNVLQMIGGHGLSCQRSAMSFQQLALSNSLTPTLSRTRSDLEADR